MVARCFKLIFNFHSCTNFKYIGDPVDGIRYKMGEYKKQFSRVVSLDLKPTDEELEKQAKVTL